MPIFDLYSKRKRDSEKAGQADVYVYTDAPRALRVQIQQIFTDAIGQYHTYDAYEMHTVPNNNDTWAELCKIIRRERGVHSLSNDAYNPFGEMMGFIGSSDMDSLLDVVEICCRYIDKVASKFTDYDRQKRGIEEPGQDALEELNYRFRRAGVGFQYENGMVIRVDSEYMHSEVIKPALTLLSRPGFSGPESEFLQAHKHYRDGNAKDAVTWAGKAFESSMKAVCDKKGWSYPANARASDLLKVLRVHKLWPDHLDGSFEQLVSTLASGLPQVRNNEGAHGDGAIPKITPDYVAAYALHLAASKIILMINAADSGP